MLPTHRRTTHPGEMLRGEFLRPLGLSEHDVAARTGIALDTVRGLLRGTVSVTPSIAQALSDAFDTTPDVWLRLQANYDAWDPR